MQETQVPSLGWEDLLEKEMATHSSVLAWKIQWMEEPGRLQSMGSLRVGHFTFTFHFHALEKEMATHSIVLAWWAAIYGVAQSWTRLSDFTFTFHPVAAFRTWWYFIKYQ